MRSYSLLAPAKINLYLEIVGDRADGYHELVMVMQSVALADRIDLRPIGTDRIVVHCDNANVPLGPGNLAYRAADLMTRQFPDCYARYGGVEIMLHKRIPMEAGLAGGSTDAAAVLVGMDLMWQLGLTQSELQELGALLGSDVPFCVTGGTAIATGRGEQIDPLPDLDHLYVVLAKYRDVSVSTRWAYQTYRQQFGESYLSAEAEVNQRRQNLHAGPMVAAIASRDGKQIGQCLYNDLEKVVLPAFPPIVHLKEEFQKIGVLGTMMSGSGSTVFALSESLEEAETLYKKFRSDNPDPNLDLWITQFTNTGIRLTANQE